MTNTSLFRGGERDVLCERCLRDGWGHPSRPTQYQFYVLHVTSFGVTENEIPNPRTNSGRMPHLRWSACVGMTFAQDRNGVVFGFVASFEMCTLVKRKSRII